MLAYFSGNPVSPLKPLFNLPVPLEKWPIADRGWANNDVVSRRCLIADLALLV